jgi:hypothetical protein
MMFEWTPFVLCELEWIDKKSMCKMVWNNVNKTPWKGNKLVTPIKNTSKENKSKQPMDTSPNLKMKLTMIFTRTLNKNVNNRHKSA